MGTLTERQLAQLAPKLNSENARRQRNGQAPLTAEQFAAEYRAQHAGTYTFLDVDDGEVADPTATAAGESMLNQQARRNREQLGLDGSGKSMLERMKERNEQACTRDREAAE